MKIGIEIHQRLDTNKLFCDCPCSIDENEQPKATIRRKLHPVLSELGVVDAASKSEHSKGKEFEYQIFSNNCLIETDEEPPKKMNQEALQVALGVALSLNATILDEIHVMRKMVIDGSNTSGFQRTAIIAVNGHVESSKGTIKIHTIAIEEESAGIVSSNDTSATYRLDRLGVPLIEITTSPDIKDGAHLREVAEKIGLILRTNSKVARGLGTIRQDLNVSTEGGSRVEIKGAQDLKMLGELVEGEAKRQEHLLSILYTLREKKVLPIKEHFVDLTNSLSSTSASLIKKGIDSGSIVLAQKMPHHKGLIGREIQNGKRYGTELSDYAKLAGVKGLIHSDEDLSKYGLNQSEIDSIRKALHLEDVDAFIMVVAPEKQANSALSNALVRANLDFVPGETRRANQDGTTTFMRPIPGKARMYPETDIPPVVVGSDLLSSISKGESLDEKRSRLEKLLNKDMAATMLKSRNLHLFERLVSLGVEPTLAANTLENTLVSLRREGIEFTDLEKTLLELFGEYQKGLFVKAAIPDVLKYMAKGARVDAVLKVYRLGKITGAALEKLVAENQCNMQLIMQKYRLQVDSKEVSDLVNKMKCDNPAYR